MEFPEENPALVYTESAGGGLFLEAEADVERYRVTFQHLVAQALSPAETTKFITDASKDV